MEQNQQVVGDDTQTKGSAKTEEEVKEVSFSTHKRLLGEKKKAVNRISELEQRLASYELQNKEQEEKEQEAQGQWQTLKSSYQESMSKMESQLQAYKQRDTDAQKLNALNKFLPAKPKKSEYYSFVELDDIILDPTTGKVDEDSAKIVAQNFAENFGDLLGTTNNAKIPQHQANGSSYKAKGLKDFKTTEALIDAYVLSNNNK